MTNYELAEKLGVSRSCICKLQFMYGLEKSKEHRHYIRVKAGKASDKSRGGKWPGMCQAVIDKRVARYNETKRKEEIRIKWGLPQKTKIRIALSPIAYRKHVYYLKSLGYIIDEVRKVAYYTNDTRRARRVEKVPRGKKIGDITSYFTFMPYENSTTREG